MTLIHCFHGFSSTPHNTPTHLTRIELSHSSFIAFLDILAPSSGVGGRWLGVSEGMWDAPTCTHVHAHGYTHTHANVKHVNKHDTQEGSHFQFLYILG